MGAVNGVPMVATPAEIDLTTADQFRAALLHAAGNGHPVVMVDMTSTRFCDSAEPRECALARRHRHGGWPGTTTRYMRQERIWRRRV